MRRTIPMIFSAASLLALNSACATPEMTNAEVLQALSESADSSRGEAATTEPIEISTEFTIGDAVEAAAEELAAFWESQAPCTTITHAGSTITIDYGGLDDDCEFNGNNFGGIAMVTVDNATMGELQVSHDWDGINNGDVQVDGGAVVTWSGSDNTRHVTTDHTWTAIDDGEIVDVQGDHVWGPLDESAPILGGFTLDGTRDWQSETGDWHIDMVGLEIRLQDPVAQAGLISLTNPDGKELELHHERIDERTIRVTLTGTRRDWVFDINQLGIPTEVEEEPAS